MTDIREPVITPINGRFRAKLYVLKEERLNGHTYEYDWGSSPAEARAASYERQRRRGAVSIDALRKGEVTVDSWMEQHIEFLRTITKIRVSSLYTYRKLHELYLRPHIGTIKLKDLAPVHISQLQQRMASAGLSTARIKATTNFLGYALRRAYEQEIIARNPMDRVGRLPPAKTEARRSIPKEEIDRMLAVFAGTWWHDHVLLLVYTGMRRGEMLGLRRRDVNLEAGVIEVRCTLIVTGGDVIHQEYAKTKAGRRSIPIAPRLLEMLRTRLEWTEEYGLDGPLFPARAGGWQNPDSFHGRFTAKTKQIGIEAWPHLLRHAHASILLRQTGNLAQVSRHLGHANTAITASTYAHAMEDVDHGLATAIGDALK